MTAGAKLAIKNGLLLQIFEFEHLATFLRGSVFEALTLLTWKAFSTINNFYDEIENFFERKKRKN
jgi:hypothetical protein